MVKRISLRRGFILAIMGMVLFFSQILCQEPKADVPDIEVTLPEEASPSSLEETVPPSPAKAGPPKDGSRGMSLDLKLILTRAVPLFWTES